ncbi:BQ2448_7362 [Microbotryum intermedium]|uniref:BQ2448_7362 protein n=1 Tax=Microbotryum intermedium TaxID=269621 RepID=A0A238FQR6_9BASI|nr:BQ2448_7362 [Microbotryum intermedium]
MAPFPSRRSSSASILPTSIAHHPQPQPSGTTSYPPANGTHDGSTSSHQDGSAPTSPRVSSPAPSTSGLTPKQLYGGVDEPQAGLIHGPGRSYESKKVVRQLLEENHITKHTYFNDDGFHNHAAHHLLASYSLGAPASLLKSIWEVHLIEGTKPMLPLHPIGLTEANWTKHLGNEKFYPNYLAFFMRQIKEVPLATSQYAERKSSVIPVLERYLLGGQGQMLVRAVSGALHGLINIGYGVEFGLDALVAEGLAQSAVTSPQVSPLFDAAWPPPQRTQTAMQFTLSSALSSFKLGSGSFGTMPIASPSDSFVQTAARLPRERRVPREGLAGFTILERILHDARLAPNVAVFEKDFPKLGNLLKRRADVIIEWCDEWKFSCDVSPDYGEEHQAKRKEGTPLKTPNWEEVVEKCEELMWMATVSQRRGEDPPPPPFFFLIAFLTRVGARAQVLYASSSRPGYACKPKMDFFIMHGLTSVLFLPAILEAVSPHFRPYILHTHFRMIVSYWISRGRPNLWVKETLMAAPLYPMPPDAASPSTSAVARYLASLRRKEESESGSDGVPKTPQVDANGRLRLEEELAEATDTPMDLLGGGNPWSTVLASAVDHPDDHVAKVIRSLAFAATHFGQSPAGFYQSSLPGTEIMDGSIFIRAAGMTLQAMGWCHEGESPGSWDRSGIGFESAWDNEPRISGYDFHASRSSSSSFKGKQRLERPDDQEEDDFVGAPGSRSRSNSPPRFGQGLGFEPLMPASPARAVWATSHSRPGSGASTPRDGRTLTPIISEDALETRLMVGRGDEVEREEEARRRRDAEEDEDRELMA